MFRYLLLVLVPLLVFGRLNPFEPVMLEKEQNSVEKRKQDTKMNQKNIIRIVSKGEDKKELKLVSKDEDKKELKKVFDKVDISKLKPNILKTTKIKTNKTPLYKPKTIKVLPFITIDMAHTFFKVTSRKKYKVLRYYFLQDEKKVVFDFRAKVNMRTRFKKIKNHPFFEYYKIGNHPKLNDYFFRVVLKLKKDIKYYKVVINNNTAMIHYNR